jgi:hypothetical protein
VSGRPLPLIDFSAKQTRAGVTVKVKGARKLIRARLHRHHAERAPRRLHPQARMAIGAPRACRSSSCSRSACRARSRARRSSTRSSTS